MLAVYSHESRMRYAVTVSRTRQGWRAAFPDIPQCTVKGASEEDVLARARAALARWLRGHLAEGSAPAPQRRLARGLAIDVPHELAFAIDLRDARVQAALSRSELALRAGVPTELVCDLEAALTPPVLAKVIPIANVLGVRPVIELERPAEAIGLTRRRTTDRGRPPSKALAADDRRGPGARSSPPMSQGPRPGATPRMASDPRAETRPSDEGALAPSALQDEGVAARSI